MSRLHAIELHLLMLAGIAFLCISGWQVWTRGQQLETTLAAANGTIASLNGNLEALNGTRAKLELDLDEGHRLLLEAGLTARDARKASDLELKYLPQWNRQITETMGNVNQTITALQGTAKAATETLHDASLDLETLNDSIQATKPLIEAGTDTVKHYDAMAPTLSATADNVKRMTSDGARITKDAADEADKLSHPPKKKLTFWGGFWVGMQYVHKLMPPIF